MIVVGYTPDAYGRAALEHGLTEARVRDTGVTVLNATKGDALADPRFADSTEVSSLQETLEASGVGFVVEQDVFGNFQFEQRRRQSGRRQHGGNFVLQVTRAELRR